MHIHVFNCSDMFLQVQYLPGLQQIQYGMPFIPVSTTHTLPEFYPQPTVIHPPHQNQGQLMIAPS